MLYSPSKCDKLDREKFTHPALADLGKNVVTCCSNFKRKDDRLNNAVDRVDWISNGEVGGTIVNGIDQLFG